MGPSGYVRLAAPAAVTLVMAVVLSAALHAYAQDNGDSGDEDGNWMRRSTWELSTSLAFYRYLEPFERTSSAYACRNRCVRIRGCTGWTYYDANFRDAGDVSYRLQRVCVLGAGLKDRQYGNRPGRTSGVVTGEGAED